MKIQSKNRNRDKIENCKKIVAKLKIINIHDWKNGGKLRNEKKLKIVKILKLVKNSKNWEKSKIDGKLDEKLIIV